MRKTILIMMMCLCALTAMRAQDAVLKMRLDGSSVEGATMTDAVSGIRATLKNGAAVEPMDSFMVVSLGATKGYVNLSAAAGQLLAGMDSYSISVYYLVDEEATVDGMGYFLWAFSTMPANTASEGAYTGYRLNVQRIAASPGGYGAETGAEVGTASPRGKWMHVAYTQDGAGGKLYINGKLTKSIGNMPKNSAVFAAGAPEYCWVGRAPFSADNYLASTLVYDFALYQGALTAAEVAQKAELTGQLDEAYLHGTAGDPAQLESCIEAAAQKADGGKDRYMPGAVADLEDVLIAARLMVERGGYTQRLYDKMQASVERALKAMLDTEGMAFDLSDVTEAYDPDRGFVHPGGMHTQADFDRIKRQLAEGNQKVTEAYNVLKASEWAQSGTATWPVETIIRGGGSGQNYINAARGAAIAYQNALRWKIEGNKAFARHAVDVLMAWARVCKTVGGDSNWALAAGLYGYEFAQAAELVRDYEGWSREDFKLFQDWMLRVWYAGNIKFLRGRNGTWENWVGNQGGYRPGHYWSNWPLCNALSAITIGILCDDVFIYNQGLSFLKYDQAGTFKDPRTADPILNDGCTEFIGNLVVTKSKTSLETGAYGEMGQMQESGRDGGHAAMALGLAVDIAHTAWNQGDDLFSYMDNRLAAGIEFVAACTQNVQGLPWTNYKYVDCRTAWHNGWLMGGPAEPAEVRNYWGTVIGHYEGVKGVKMPYAERAYSQMGVDGGPYGGASGPYDHLGFSVLTNTYDGIAPADRVPTLLTPKMEYDGKVIDHNELGGLTNTFNSPNTTGLPKGSVVKLMPQLPEGAEDTGKWRWNTGETTKDITVTADRSYMYRVTYTNANGIESHQVFAMAVQGDCQPSPGMTTTATSDGQTAEGGATLNAFYGSEATLTVSGWLDQTTCLWDNGETGFSRTTKPIVRDRDFRVCYQNQGGRKQAFTFRVRVQYFRPDMVVNGTTLKDTTTVVVKSGTTVVLAPAIAETAGEVAFSWSNGATTRNLDLGAVTASGSYTFRCTIGGSETAVTYYILVEGEEGSRLIDSGDYLIKTRAGDRYLTNNGAGLPVDFQPARGTAERPDASQVWLVTRKATPKYDFVSMADSMMVAASGLVVRKTYHPLLLAGAAGASYYAIYSAASGKNSYWTVDGNGTVDVQGAAERPDYPFELVPADWATGIHGVTGGETVKTELFSIGGTRISAPERGLYIIKKTLKDGTTVVEKHEKR